MKVVIAGGTGFLGRPLTATLLRDGHDVVVLTRAAASSRQTALPRSPRAHGASRGIRTAPAAPGPRKSTAPTPWSTSPANRSPASGGAARRSSGFSTAASRRPAAWSPRSAPPLRRRRSSSADPRSATTVRSATKIVTEETAAGIRFSGAGVRAMGAGGDARVGDRTRVALHPHRHRARAGRRRAAADAAAVPVRRGRTGRIGPSVLAVDSPRRLDRARAVDDRHAGGRAARSTRRRRIRSPTPRSRARSAARCIVPRSCRRPVSR